jgi:stage V sporulation protein AC
LIGGTICTVGELLSNLFLMLPFADAKVAGTLTSVSLIFLSVLSTALGFYDNIAKYAGAGTLVPITGFANAVVSPAIDCKAEGWVLGVGAKIFTVAGPVLLYGTLAGAVWGVIYWTITLF